LFGGARPSGSAGAGSQIGFRLRGAPKSRSSATAAGAALGRAEILLCSSVLCSGSGNVAAPEDTEDAHSTKKNAERAS
jgi:hypothetical protein